MTWMLWVLSALYLAAFGLLLWVARRSRGWYAAAKGLCSGLFVLCGVLAFVLGSRNRPPEFAILMTALVLCAFGDVFLGVANNTAGKVSKKPFLFGAGSFLAAHVAFCVLFYLRSPFKWYDLVLSLALLVVLRLLEMKDKVRLKKMRPVGYAYTFMVGLMAGKAAESVIYAGLFTLAGAFTTLGAVLFLVSDVILLFLYFGTNRRKILRGANLFTYYLGVYLLALSAYWF